jgi:hypothetical protein
VEDAHAVVIRGSTFRSFRRTGIHTPRVFCALQQIIPSHQVPKWVWVGLRGRICCIRCNLPFALESSTSDRASDEKSRGPDHLLIVSSSSYYVYMCRVHRALVLHHCILAQNSFKFPALYFSKRSLLLWPAFH